MKRENTILSFGRCLKLGASGLAAKKFRLTAAILLSAVTAFIFGFSFVAAAANPYAAELELLYENNLNMIVVQSDSLYKPAIKSFISKKA